ncbi:MAG: type II toxin-antitoxin system HicB family antitoxin, partial [Isosphaeraceae bacterium]
MNLLIEIECEDDGRWIAEIPDLPGVNGLRSSVFQFSSSVTLRRRFCFPPGSVVDRAGGDGPALFGRTQRFPEEPKHLQDK